ncbi:molecular chaperone Hsp33 [Tistlia consotensis]|uniref:Molecular chaperone Hsp33 n=1 Tax=Tistlia consotensis USBA 355 TaxID=560819 RepID=A0A1Y6BE71_9PROT|nr:Hsp33 family molecular chaperone HslO [Tistlia consotensis]SMF06911.1 molecular chaperone Hsp33 [Tistlia consotensis USBA 355]SNR36220.1 molecular chaperone Hsp33 [Tistlia consotensis]
MSAAGFERGETRLPDWDPSADDQIQPFVLEQSGVRGRLIRLGPALDTILTRPGYPGPVARLLGELLALCGVLGSSLKYDGVFTLQIKGDGAIRTMVADLTHEGELRGYAGFDAAALAAAGGEAGGEVGREAAQDDGTIERWLGNGHMAFTVDQGVYSERYQGLVELTGPRLADSLLHYFRQSQQLNAGILVACERRGSGWRGGALLIERIPGEGGRGGEGTGAVAGEFGGDIAEEDWRRALILMASCTDAELADPAISPERLLFRLFHEEGIRVFEPQPVAVGCRCTRERVERILRSIPREQIDEMKVEGEVVMTCEFCSRDFRFDDPALDRLYGGGREDAG